MSPSCPRSPATSEFHAFTEEPTTLLLPSPPSRSSSGGRRPPLPSKAAGGALLSFLSGWWSGGRPRALLLFYRCRLQKRPVPSPTGQHGLRRPHPLSWCLKPAAASSLPLSTWPMCPPSRAPPYRDPRHGGIIKMWREDLKTRLSFHLFKRMATQDSV